MTWLKVTLVTAGSKNQDSMTYMELGCVQRQVLEGKNERTRGYETGQLGKPAAKGESDAIWNEIEELRRVELDLADVVRDEEREGMW